MKVVALLESMWDWRSMTGAGEAPRSFRINPENHSGRRLYKLIGEGCDLRVTNSCREVQRSANHHGTPDPAWVHENLTLLQPFGLLLICGKVAQATFKDSCYIAINVIEMPHPAARMWSKEMIAKYQAQIRAFREL